MTTEQLEVIQEMIHVIRDLIDAMKAHTRNDRLEYEISRDQAYKTLEKANDLLQEIKKSGARNPFEGK